MQCHLPRRLAAFDGGELRWILCKLQKSHKKIEDFLSPSVVNRLCAVRSRGRRGFMLPAGKTGNGSEG